MRTFLLLVALCGVVTGCVIDPGEHPYKGTVEEMSADAAEEMPDDATGETLCRTQACVCPARRKCEDIVCARDECLISCENADKCKLKCGDEQSCVLRCGDNESKDCKFQECDSPVQCKDGVSVCNRDCPSGLERDDDDDD